MNDPDYDIELIERYFDQNLSSDEKKMVENRLRHDAGFKKLFEQERVLIGAIKFEGALSELEYLKEIEKDMLFRDSVPGEEKHSHPDSQSKLRRLLPYFISAAACLLIIVVVVFYLKPDSPQRMASQYTAENLLYLSTTMSEVSDSLTLGIAAYNSADYDKAERIFRSIAENTGSLEAIKNLGLTYLASRQYDKAIQQFNRLSDRDDIHVNWGPFYKAVALMLRSASGDEEEAKEILRDMVEKQLPGHQVASGWLDRW